ncbi:FAD-binding protein [Selenihalanaerobacter shriftii]|uniref:Succinate dehydrogenase / fumarate reductase flavoprotein subunit n=1 Tax=Selenihalanaerobacter shriftii TaxID=142842 RepID=A0A1T4JJG5_9FIRM|nr:FAD-binding protein [Selenihalanaerobacter shriftii]SJZ30302.1 succinate dehydrogenase / fumarate reductase flavoprotein subunit [Selenihalanaerobacter shriftii]
MEYLPSMEDSIKKVEATREERINEEFPRLDDREAEKLLSNYHPDYIEARFRELKVGVNQGDRMSNELIDLLEAKSKVDLGEINLKEISYETDVLVIGGGGAGSAAALAASEQGVDVLLATKLRHGDANTIMAQGGIQAAVDENDSPALHYLDAIGGGHFKNIPELIEALVYDAPMVIKWLEELGVIFDKNEEGRMKLRKGGGNSKRRIHFAKDYIGLEIMHNLRDEVRNKGIKVIEFAPAVELILDDKEQAAGAILYNLESESYSIIKAKTVILATGGIGRLHTGGFATTNHYGATADGLVMAYRVGAKLIFMDSMQYHPTGAIFPQPVVGLLVSERTRSLGAQEVNINGESFINPLELRDVSAAAIIRECEERNKGVKTSSGLKGVWLDIPLIDLKHGQGTIQEELPAMVRQFARFGIDVTKEPVLVYPALHYQNGGIKINERTESKITNLFAAGEVAGGVHGRNRLMGNSLLDIIVFGRRSGKNAADKARKIQLGKLNLEHIKEYNIKLEELGIQINQTSPKVLPDYNKQSNKLYH